MLSRFLSSPQILKLEHGLQEGRSILVEELWNAPKALVAALAQQTTGKNILILTAGTQEENRLYHDFPFFTERTVVDFPAWETLPNESTPPSPDVVGERYKVLERIFHAKEPLIILSSLQAALQRLIPSDTFELFYLDLKEGDIPGFDMLVNQLKDMGYVRSAVAADKGEYAIRGGIIDVFPVNSPDPFRIEFFGDQIESLRIYDPIGQKSIRPVANVTITPGQELELIAGENKLMTLLDYLKDNVILIFDDLLAIEDRYSSLISMMGKPGRTFCSMEEFMQQANALQKIFWSAQTIDQLSDIQTLDKKAGSFYSASANLIPIAFEALNRRFEADRWHHPFIPVADYLILPEGAESDAIVPAIEKLTETEVYLLAASVPEQDTWRRKFQKTPEFVHFELGYLSSGFGIRDINTLIIPFTEISHRYKIRRQKLRSTYHTPASESFHLEVGDPIVHMQNGIGRYLGLEKRPDASGAEQEFFHVEYAENARMFVPLNQAHLITKYIGADDTPPQLSKLGSAKWKKAREKTQQAILGYAQDLLNIYAERTLKGGYAFPEECIDSEVFADEFPFVETEDQLAAIDAITRDMTSPNPMDRLVCGDVGYGKTEVAMRAAYRAACAGKQVAVLVPTTVLAMQHFDNFTDRMSNYPITIGVLSRFRTPKQIKETLKAVEEGKVDILIGTHRIISQDVKFKDLGLVIIDEEQRFGVRAKEHLKKIKAGVDCITLSATPIPRTLYMSLVGARDMSVINTPPQDRLPIASAITETTDDLLRTAIMRELARDGQVYVVHNRVESIYAYADRIKQLLPQARIMVAHGQMDSDELDMVFHAFKKGEIDILVATTIIENGIDIPNANTILIDRADTFGLASLYQLRGRVGRWNRRAYAYFLVPNRTTLNEITRRRLNALAESSGYGGGMKLAMRDLEIRGAGDILGTEQSGHVAAVGFALYCKMLTRTVKTLQGGEGAYLTDVKMVFPFDAKFTEAYINAPSLRMDLYQRLGEAASLQEVDLIWEEIVDRFGAPPQPAEWLYRLTRIRVHAARKGVTMLKLEKVSITIEYKNGQMRKSIFAKHSSPADFEEKMFKILDSD